MKTFYTAHLPKLVLAAVLFVFPFVVSAEALNIPSGWTATGGGSIEKGSSKVSVGELQELGDASATEFMDGIKNTVPEGGELLTPDKPLKEGEYVVQVTRQIKLDGIEAHSNLMICKQGVNKNRLIELYVERSKTLDIIFAGKYAIAYCAQ